MGQSENIKSYVGYRDITISNAITTKGLLTNNPLVSQKSSADIGLAVRLTPSLYFGLYGSYSSQSSNKDQASFFTNPNVGGRLTLWQPNQSKVLLPQVQLLFSYTPKIVTARSESQTRDLVDVFGSEFHEINLGYDIWNDKNKLLLGVTQSINYGFKSEVLDEMINPPWKLASSLTTGVKLFSSVRVLAGYNHLYGHYRYDNDIKAPDSRSINHSFFTTVDLKWNKTDNLKFSYTSGGHFNSFNTTISKGFSLAYLKTWD